MFFESAWEGLLIVLSWPNVLYPVIGTLLAMGVAFIPGLSGVTLLALAVSWTLQWDALHVVLLFGALVGGATFMGSITAILFNIPGTAPNAATLLDGYPMAQKGEARTAIACAASASAFGSTVGVALMIVLIPVLRPLILAVGPVELLLLAVWGLGTVAMVTRGAVLKGLIAAGFGLAVGFVGLDPRTAESRFTFGLEYLDEGIPIVPAFLGLFAFAEVIDLYVSGRRTIGGDDVGARLGGSVREGLLTVFRYPGVFLKSSLLGTGVGMIPGIGGTVAGFIAYGQAARSDPESFGQGDIRGVLAPESANDSKDAGALVPMLAFGIPGSEGSAILLTTLVLHGVTPGRELLENQLTLVFVLIWSLFLSNWLTSIIGLLAAPQLARFTIVPAYVLVPVISVLLILASIAYRGSFEDLLVAVVFGVAGYAMKVYGWPRVSFVIALVLAALFENNLHLTLRLSELGRLDPVEHPLALGLLGLLGIMTGWPLVRWLRARREQVH